MRRTPLLTPCALALAALLVGGGCVERKMTIRSDPPGATVLLEDDPVAGRTPVEVPFTWGGARQVTLLLAGHRPLDTVAEVEDPWYTWFPLDVLAEFAWPGTIEDHQEFAFQLEAYHPLDKRLTDEQRAELKRRMDELRQRGEEYRAGGSEGPGAIRAPEPETTGEAQED